MSEEVFSPLLETVVAGVAEPVPKGSKASVVDTRVLVVGVVHSGSNKANGTEKFVHHCELPVRMNVHDENGEEGEKPGEKRCPLV